MYLSPCFCIFSSPRTKLGRLLQTLGAVIGFQSLQPFVLSIFAHVLDNISSDVVHLVNGVDFHEPSTPNLLKLQLLDERQIANHVVVYRSAFLELDDGHVFQLGVSVLQTKNEKLEMLIACLYVRYIEIDLAESQRNELATAIEIHANELTNTVPPFALSVPVIMLIFDSGTVTVFFALSTAGGIESFVSRNLANPLRYNDFLIVTIQQNHPLSEGANRSVFLLIRNV